MGSVGKEAQDEIKKEEKRMWRRFIVCIVSAMVFFAMSMTYQNYDSASQTFWIPATIGLGIGFIFLGGSFLFNFETTKKLIQLEYRLDSIIEKSSKDD